MSEESSNLTSMRIANTPNGVDLRKIGAHPDYWYPLAWCDELKAGKAIGRRFAGEPVVLYRENTVRCSRSRIAVPTGRCRFISASSAAMSSNAITTVGPTAAPASA